MVFNREEASHPKMMYQAGEDEFLSSVHAGDGDEMQARYTVTTPLTTSLSCPSSSLLFFLYSSKPQRNDSSCHRDSLHSPPAEYPLTTMQAYLCLHFLLLSLLPPNSYHSSGTFSVKTHHWFTNLGILSS